MRKPWLAELAFDHRDQREDLAALVQLLQGPAPELHAARQIATAIHQQLELHLAFEEEVLCPWAERLLADGAQLIARMRREHEAIRVGLIAARYALHQQQAEQASARFVALGRGLAEHHAWEEELADRLRSARAARRTAAG